MKTHFRKTLLLVTLFLLTASLFPPATSGQAVSAAEPPTPAGDFKAGELLVKFETGMTFSATENLLSRYQATQIRILYRSDVQLWQVPAGKELEIIASLNANPAVAYAEPNYLYHAFDTIPNDPHFFGKQWAHTKIQSPAAWDITTGSNAITIAIIDTGIDEGHPDLASKIVAGYDYVGDDSNPHDLNGHGTHCAGIAAAITDNNTGVAGVSWGAKIMPVRVLDADGSGWSSDITNGITWAYFNGADVLSLSLGGPGYSISMQAAINDAHAAGSLVIAAMGNDRTEGNPTSYPAAYDNVMAVAATGPTDTYADYSQYGDHCDIAAPGGAMDHYHDPDGIYSTLPTYHVTLNDEGFAQSYDYLQGTSMATPYVAGLAALVWSVSSSLTPDEVQAIIEDSADDLGATGWDSTYGHGRINAFAALQATKPAAPVLTLTNLPAEGDYVLDWNDVSGAVSYTLEESASASFTTSFVRYIGANSVYNVTGQRAGAWYYRVRARDASWTTSDWSNIQSHTVSTLPLPAPPLHNIPNLDKDDTYTVTWSTMISATGYILEESNSRYFDAPTQVYSDTGAVHNVAGQDLGTWHYRVRATGATGNSPWSFVKNVRVAPYEIFLPLVMRN